MTNLPDIFDKFLNDPFMNMNMFNPQNSQQCVSVQQNHYTDDDGNYILEIDVPGFSKDTLTVQIDEDLLTIKGKTERRQVDRVFRISRETSKVHAKIAEGVLRLTFEKDRKTVPLSIE